MIKHIFIVALVLSFTSVLQAGITSSVEVTGNSNGDDVYVITLSSDNGLVSSLGLIADGPSGNLGQVYPFGLSTVFEDNKGAIFAIGIYEPRDTHAKFHSVNNNLLVVPGAKDTVDEFEVFFTGFEPFAERAVFEVVLLGGSSGSAMINAVVGGLEYSLIPPVTYGPNGSVLNLPEPGSVVVLALGAMAVMRRR